MSESSTYIGRFAPSPSGPLHFGSLVAAIASFLDARANQGTWLVRVEDLDPAREPEGAADLILSQLDDFGMRSDQPIVYQSSRLKAYEKALLKLQKQDLTFDCACTRQQIKSMGSVYNGACRSRSEAPIGDFAIRVKIGDKLVKFIDLVQGPVSQKLSTDIGDFVIKRKDRLFAYQLAVVVDDAFQRITHVIRGFDLLASTPRQIYLQQVLGFTTPIYAHVPIAVNQLGQKLSKQHFADPVAISNKRILLHTTLNFLGMSPPISNARLDVDQQLQWGVLNWDIHNVPKLANIPHHSKAT